MSRSRSDQQKEIYQNGSHTVSNHISKESSQRDIQSNLSQHNLPTPPSSSTELPNKSVDNLPIPFKINYDPDKPREEHSIDDFYPNFSTSTALPFIVIPTTPLSCRVEERRSLITASKTNGNSRKTKENLTVEDQIQNLLRNNERAEAISLNNAKRELKRPVFNIVKQNDVYQPEDIRKETSQTYSPYHREDYHHFITSDSDCLDHSYTMDDQDHYFLTYYNKNGLRKDREDVTNTQPQLHTQITEDIFELSITHLEHQWNTLIRQMPTKSTTNISKLQDHITKYSSDIGITAETLSNPNLQPCCICLHSATPEINNSIIYCDNCDIAVHQDCYGVGHIPLGDWYCRRCEVLDLLGNPMHATIKKGKNVVRNSLRCVFCPSTTGAFKQLQNGRWCHVICALWIPELYFSNVGNMEPIDGILGIPSERWKLTCYICKEADGACVQCSNRACVRAFHVTCSLRAGLFMSLDGNDYSYDDTDINGSALVLKAIHSCGKSMRCFCQLHSPKNWHGATDVKDRLQRAKLYFKEWYGKTVKERRSVNEIPQSKTDTTINEKRKTRIKWLTKDGTPIPPDFFITKLSDYLSTRLGSDTDKTSINSISLLMTRYWVLKNKYISGNTDKRSLIKIKPQKLNITGIPSSLSLYNGTNGSEISQTFEFNEELIKDLERLEMLGFDILKRFENRLEAFEAENVIIEAVISNSIEKLPPDDRQAALTEVFSGLKGKDLKILFNGDYYKREIHHMTEFKDHYLPQKKPITESSQSDTTSSPKKKNKRQYRVGQDKICTNCQSSETSLWRYSRLPESQGACLCNACGVYEIRHFKKRPIENIEAHLRLCSLNVHRKSVDELDPLPVYSMLSAIGPQDPSFCTVCDKTSQSTSELRYWRQSKLPHSEGNLVCGACYTYEQRHGVTRLELLRERKLAESNMKKRKKKKSNNKKDEGAEDYKSAHPPHQDRGKSKEKETSLRGTNLQVAKIIESPADVIISEQIVGTSSDVGQFAESDAHFLMEQEQSSIFIQNYLKYIHPELKPQGRSGFAWRYLVDLGLVTSNGLVILEKEEQLIEVLKQRKIENQKRLDEEYEEMERIFEEEQESKRKRREALKREKEQAMNLKAGNKKRKKSILDSLKFDVNFPIPFSETDDATESQVVLQVPLNLANLSTDVEAYKEIESKGPSSKRKRPLRHAAALAIEQQHKQSKPLKRRNVEKHQNADSDPNKKPSTTAEIEKKNMISILGSKMTQIQDLDLSLEMKSVDIDNSIINETKPVKTTMIQGIDQGIHSSISEGISPIVKSIQIDHTTGNIDTNIMDQIGGNSGLQCINTKDIGSIVS